MHDIRKLEEEWHLYNRKKRRPFYFLIAIVIVLLLLITLYLNSWLQFKINKIGLGELIGSYFKDGNTTTIQNTPVTHKNISVTDDKVIVTNKIASIATEKSVDMQVSKNISLSAEPSPYDTAKVSPVLEVSDSPVGVEQSAVNVPQNGESNGKKIHLDILETSSVTAYKDVERRFYQTHDADDSLFLAKSYFNRGEYKKAEYWALQTNKVDDDIEESWLLFAESRAKLGHKQDAIKVLRSYIKRSNSLEARRLLEKIK